VTTSSFARLPVNPNQTNTPLRWKRPISTPVASISRVAFAPIVGSLPITRIVLYTTGRVRENKLEEAVSAVFAILEQR
jgi:hypothetical protein